MAEIGRALLQAAQVINQSLVNQQQLQLQAERLAQQAEQAEQNLDLREQQLKLQEENLALAQQREASVSELRDAQTEATQERTEALKSREKFLNQKFTLEELNTMAEDPGLTQRQLKIREAFVQTAVLQEKLLASKGSPESVMEGLTANQRGLMQQRAMKRAGDMAFAERMQAFREGGNDVQQRAAQLYQFRSPESVSQELARLQTQIKPLENRIRGAQTANDPATMQEAQAELEQVHQKIEAGQVWLDARVQASAKGALDPDLQTAALSQLIGREADEKLRDAVMGFHSDVQLGNTVLKPEFRASQPDPEQWLEERITEAASSNDELSQEAMEQIIEQMPNEVTSVQKEQIVRDLQRFAQQRLDYSSPPAWIKELVTKYWTQTVEPESTR